uniref:Uncharacterized protein n=1 Tax=Anguilla anguilla TaxID=7936 RepID=A0A0E9WSD6_ANGAN
MKWSSCHHSRANLKIPSDTQAHTHASTCAHTQAFTRAHRHTHKHVSALSFPQCVFAQRKIPLLFCLFVGLFFLSSVITSN